MNTRLPSILCVLFAAALPVWAQYMDEDDDDTDVPRRRGPTIWEVEQSQVEARRQAAERIIGAWKGPMPEDPLRLVDGVTVVAAGPGWVRISGTPLEITADGLRVKGSFRTLDDPFHFNTYRGEFFVADFPYVTTNGSQVNFPEHLSDLTAKKVGSLASSTNSIPLLKYGTVLTPPPPADDALARAANELQSELQYEASLLAWNQQKAQDGDTAAQLYMARCYLTGKGVEKNVATGTDYLSKAASHGNKEAIAQLQKLSSAQK